MKVYKEITSLYDFEPWSGAVNTYNKLIEAGKEDEFIDQLEQEGRALVLYPEEMPIDRTEHDTVKLENAWQKGRAQATRNIDQWLAWMEQ